MIPAGLAEAGCGDTGPEVADDAGAPVYCDEGDDADAGADDEGGERGHALAPLCAPSIEPQSAFSSSYCWYTLSCNDS